MWKGGAARTLSRSIFRPATSIPQPRIVGIASRLHTLTSGAPLSFKASPTLALALRKPTTTALLRYASTTSIDTGREQKIGHKELKPHPEEVSTGSSVRHIIHDEGGTPIEKQEPKVSAGLSGDLQTIKETFSLETVPKEALYLGMAGVIPYLATSLSTAFLSWNINHAAAYGTGVLMTGQTAEQLLHIVEPLQVGYGAVILSFLGAIHWGLEWAGYGGEKGWSRYKVGVIAPAIAWPTTLLPIEYALITQFLAFNYLYFVDAKAAAKGTAPPWYGMYRFVLTFIVGASIVISLVGRGQIVAEIGKASGPAQKIKALRDSQLAFLEREEQDREAKEADAAEQVQEE